MATTTPDSIFYRTGVDTFSDAAESASQASSVQNALSLRQGYNFVWANSTARTGQTGMTQGSTGYQVDTKTPYIYDNSAWRLQTSYSEWVQTVQSVATGVFTQPTTMTYQSGTSTDATFVSVTGGNITIAQPGIYAMSWVANIATATTTSFIDITSDVAHTQILAISPFTFDVAQANIPFIRITAANTILYLWVRHQTGAAANMTSTFRIGRIN